MNNKKICFISCVNNLRQYEESVRYIKTLDVPRGFEVEFRAVEDASSMTAGYNAAMNSSDAKFKVYLHQDVFMINRAFLHDVLKLFKKYPKLGMLGVAGAKSVPANGIWWKAEERYGKIYDSHTGKMALASLLEVEEDYKEVECIDGVIMVTQYDVPWRDDVFRGWHLYDVSQSFEFIKAGYEVGVPRQQEAWAIHDSGRVTTDNSYQENRRIFLEHYRGVMSVYRSIPLVSILIPTYNRPKYLKLAVKSALEQTYANIEIVVCDDSTNDETEKLIKEEFSEHKCIRYIKNERNLGQFENDVKLLELAQGEYVNFLMDDDLFHRDKIAKMMTYFLAKGEHNIKLIFSRRKMIDENGKLLPDNELTTPLFEEDRILDGIEFGNLVLRYNYNIIGEPTTVLFKKSDLVEPFGTFGSRRYGCNVDLATWLGLLSRGEAVYINEPLSYYRVHSGQQLQSEKMLIMGAADYAHEVLHSPLVGFFADNLAKYEGAVRYCLEYVDSVLDKVTDEFKEAECFLELIELRHKLQHRAFTQ